MLLFDVLQGLELTRNAELHTDFFQQFVKMLSYLSTCEIVSLDGVRQSIAFIDGHS